MHSQGCWTLGLSVRAGPEPTTGAGTAEAALKIEIELSIQPYALLTAAECKDQATNTKTTPAKCRAAFPGDEDKEPVDKGLNPFAEWSWEQTSSRCQVQEVYLWSTTSGVNIQV